ncbi:MAG: LysR family transcriptional regulator [Betaproteobacteria bacterium]|nr:MAG: LysR family transcriptional regulator [Betaproteobacteria bacterium]
MTRSATLNPLLRVTPQQLRAFEATARLLSVTRAAESLHVTQPTVSVQLRELAEAVGEPLFETVGRRIQLTQAGEAMRQAVEEWGALWQRFESRLAEIHGLVRGRLRIAAVTTAEYFVPDLLGPFAAAHPGVAIELAVENRDRVIERLQRGTDDLAVMMLPPEDLPLERVPFLDNPLVVIAASSHPLAAQSKRIALSRLARERWLLRESGSGTRMAAEQFFAAHDFAPNIAMSLGSNEAIKHAVNAGLGIAVVSRLAVANELASVSPTRGASGQPAHAGLVELRVTGFPIERQWSVVWRRDQPLSAAARRFVAYLRDAAT